jgi:hypothetical protein
LRGSAELTGGPGSRLRKISVTLLGTSVMILLTALHYLCRLWLDAQEIERRSLERYPFLRE